jgi:hypothetical protein
MAAKAALDFAARWPLTKETSALLVFWVKTTAVPKTVIPSSSGLAT